MGKVIDLASYRGKSRKEYYRKHGAKLDRFVQCFLDTYVHVDFDRLAALYQEGVRESSALAWDYIDFREILREAFELTFAQILGEELRKQPWFDSRFTSVDQVLERCLSTFIIGRCEYATVK